MIQAKKERERERKGGKLTLKFPDHRQWDRQYKEIHYHVGNRCAIEHWDVVVAGLNVPLLTLPRLPHFTDGTTLEEVRQKERNSPNANQDNHHNSDNREHCALEYTAVEEEDRQLGEGQGYD